MEVFEAVRNSFLSDRPVGVKLSATDWVEGGWDCEQTVELARALKSRGADWITASSGGVSPVQTITVGPGYQVPFARAVKQGAGLTTVAVGLITEARQAEATISSGDADLIALAWAMLYDPRWLWYAAAEFRANAFAPPPYWRSQPHGQSSLVGAEAQTGAR